MRNKNYNNLLVLLAILLNGASVFSEIKVLEVKVPPVATRGAEVTFLCNYTLNDESHYATRWFFREELVFQVRSVAGREKKEIKGTFSVELEKSNSTNLVLNDVPLGAAGPWSCDVIGSPPRFSRDVSSTILQVAVFPLNGPVITGVPVRLGNLTSLTLNCTLERAFPPGLIHWKVNGMNAVDDDLVVYPPIEHPDNTTTTTVGINVKLDSPLRSPSIKIKCIGQILDCYWKTKEVVLKRQGIVNEDMGVSTAFSISAGIPTRCLPYFFSFIFFVILISFY
ncbi:uncharacterized protein LOC136026907 [Artemia franciscana]|uniref:Ig-like domain-containing protein n=1 Tax=Artemia franciscana TaxID=6661 RepID=A0AA88HDK9_ARTSF|nr:hypothetical protein QYM36_013174 [Artemia franciscana]KAK2709418.1 hypothetical protein QYM36_013174 [Artemia franciscana]KAK2709419.1 hypothetical protein QYM36_013174 [Artemia franciscana]